MPSLALRGVCFERLPLHRVSESCKGFLRLLGLQDAGVVENPGKEASFGRRICRLWPILIFVRRTFPAGVFYNPGAYGVAVTGVPGT